MPIVIALDGPAGTGKSSLAQALAEEFGYVYVDTGAIYRALAFLVQQENVDPNDVSLVLSLVPKIQILVDKNSKNIKIYLDKKVVSEELRTESISKLSSIVSQYEAVRKALLPVQRDLIKDVSKGAIFEGRDIGTVVFPDAPVKIFVTAKSEVRAKRRFLQLQQGEKKASYEEILQAIKDRDERDTTRKNAPMQMASDAHVMDTSKMTLKEAVKKAVDIIKNTIAKMRT